MLEADVDVYFAGHNHNCAEEPRKTRPTRAAFSGKSKIRILIHSVDMAI